MGNEEMIDFIEVIANITLVIVCIAIIVSVPLLITIIVNQASGKPLLDIPVKVMGPCEVQKVD